jgi:hypothetical protein
MINGELARRRNLTESSSHQHFSPENLNLTTSRIVARRNCGVKLLTGRAAQAEESKQFKGKRENDENQEVCPSRFCFSPVMSLLTFAKIRRRVFYPAA